jgi:transcriptional regulator with XRE-family HTH domain
MTRSRTGFGAAVERICSANHKSQSEIAAEIGVAPETVTRWKGEFSPPSGLLRKALDVLRQYEPALTAEALLSGPADDAGAGLVVGEGR